MKRFIYTAIFLLLNFSALALGGLFTSDGVQSDWYNQLVKAPWTPPGWVFGFAWTTVMVTYSLYMGYLWPRVLNKSFLITVYGFQWILNVSWNPFFFYWHLPAISLILILLLTMLQMYTFYAFLKQMHLKASFILPYIAWLVIATSLNTYIYLYN